jgi:DNA gyrase/topoisomerase IV subunit B
MNQGLGTSTNQDAKEYFSNMDTHMIPFAKMRDEERPLIELAFSKKKADDRKDWLRKLKVRRFFACHANLPDLMTSVANSLGRSSTTV